MIIFLEALSKQGQGQDLQMVSQNISQEHKEKLLDYIVDWNSNGKYCLAAQVLHIYMIYLLYYLTDDSFILIDDTGVIDGGYYLKIINIYQTL